ncbi:hypothetical protein KC19_12G041200 [Ceratodon purpureus]|uniref:Uncharacterized protein n=1 Tax=Ceratodon purpureus TaxID=3225 RepID=A0A8T0G3L7_CERPU|nr:hypothetical protein KC19_12G041200 [Ceratodon purpureus]
MQGSMCVSRCWRTFAMLPSENTGVFSPRVRHRR